MAKPTPSTFGWLALLLAPLLVAAAVSEPEPRTPENRGVLDHTMKRIDGAEQSLRDFEGQVLLLVNVASKCGLTPQYEGLEKLYDERKEEGFAVLGFPANQFAGQEPGTDAEIAEFCRATYAVEFPMFSKIVVKGEGIHPLYDYLTGLPEPLGGEIEWNFQKFLVDRKGEVVARFSPRTPPDAPEIVAKIDALLAEAR